MSPSFKGILSVIFGILGNLNFLVSVVVLLNMLQLPYNFLSIVIFHLLTSVLAIYFGIKARSGGARITGLIGVVLGVIGTLSHILRFVA
ncbi:MAG: hypothetical protein RLZZ67_457 [Candidatus Parcubacteria bacterium]|jgi:predicted permease